MSVSFPQKSGPWTVDDLPDEGRFEIVDGALVVSPPPSPPHEAVVSAMHLVLGGRLGARRVLTSGGITIAKVNYRVPDVLVLRESVDVWGMREIAPADVLLAVEVVSPS